MADSQINSNSKKYLLICAAAKIPVLGREIEKEDIYLCEDFLILETHNNIPRIVAFKLEKNSFLKKLILKSNTFSFNFFSKIKKNTLEEIKKNGEFFDKFKKTDLEKKEGFTILSPTIADAELICECEVENILDFASNSLVIGKVLQTSKKS